MPLFTIVITSSLVSGLCWPNSKGVAMPKQTISAHRVTIFRDMLWLPCAVSSSLLSLRNRLARPGIETPGAGYPNVYAVVRLGRSHEAVGLKSAAASPWSVYAHFPRPAHLNSGTLVPIDAPVISRRRELVVIAGICAREVFPLQQCVR